MLLWCFVTILTLKLIFISYFHSTSFRPLTKPLLVSILLFYFLLHRTGQKTKLEISLALLFSLLGNILLLFTGRSENYFMLGLVAFLFAHIFYIVQFSMGRNKKRRVLKPYFPY